jgi:hypothetical protein
LLQCEDHLPYYRDNSCCLQLATTPRPPLRDSRLASRQDLGGGARGPGPAQVGFLVGASMQREGAVPGSSHRIFIQTKALSTSNCSYGRAALRSVFELCSITKFQPTARRPKVWLVLPFAEDPGRPPLPRSSRVKGSWSRSRDKLQERVIFRV